MVSIIIPNYNHAPFLDERIQSVLNQSYQDFEVILLDDFSTDNSRKVLEKYGNHEKVKQVVFNDKNSGSPFKQWKKGLDLAQGDLIWIAESDDVAHPDFLEKAVESLNASSADLVFCQSFNIDPAGIIKNDYLWHYETYQGYDWKADLTFGSNEFITNIMFHKNAIVNASSVLFRKKEGLGLILDKIQNFYYCGDWLFWIEYVSLTQKTSYLSEKLNYFRSHDSSTRAKASNLENAKRFFEIYMVKKWMFQKFKLFQYKSIMEVELDYSMRFVTIGNVFRWLTYCTSASSDKLRLFFKYLGYRIKLLNL